VEFTARKAQIDLAIIRAIETPISMIDGCTAFSITAGDYIKKLRHRDLWPIAIQCQAKSISIIFRLVLDMPEIGPIRCGSVHCRTCLSIGSRDMLRQEIGKISGIKRGLCLDCVKALRVQGENADYVSLSCEIYPCISCQ